MKLGATTRIIATHFRRHQMLMRQVVKDGLEVSRMHSCRVRMVTLHCPAGGVSRSDDNSPRPFLDLETTNDSDGERRPSSETRRQEAESALDSLLSEKTAVEMKSFVNKEGNRKAALSQESAMSAP